MPVMAALGNLRQENYKPKTTLGYIRNSRPAWDKQPDHVCKITEKKIAI